MFDHVKYLKDLTTPVDHVYDSKYYKVLTIACCDMQSKDGSIHTIFWENLNSIMAENGASNMNFKGFMADNVHANWIVVKKIYIESDPSWSMVGHKCICLFHLSQSLHKVTQKYIKASLQFKHKCLCKNYKDAKQTDKAKTKYHVFRSRWLSTGVAIEEGILGLFKWLSFWHFYYRH